MNDKNKLITYIVIILLGGIVGYILGSRHKNAEIWGCIGVSAGFVIDLVIWCIYHNERFKNPLMVDSEDDK
jgi:hypothetical protein